MKWILAIVLLLQAPILFIAFIAAGTNGKKESLVQIWSIVIPIALCGVILLIRIVARSDWTRLDWVLTAIALLPTAALGYYGFVRPLLKT